MAAGRQSATSKRRAKRRPAHRSVFTLPRTGYIRTSQALRKPKRPTRLPQRKGESDKDYAARLDAARREAYERALRPPVATRATRSVRGSPPERRTGTGRRSRSCRGQRPPSETSSGLTVIDRQLS